MKTEEKLLQELYTALEECVERFQSSLSPAPQLQHIKGESVPVKWHIRQLFQAADEKNLKKACKSFNIKLIILWGKKGQNGLEPLIEDLRDILFTKLESNRDILEILKNAWPRELDTTLEIEDTLPTDDEESGQRNSP